MDVKQSSAEQIKQGYLYVVRLLAQTKRSERELVGKLKGKGYSDGAIEQIIARLKEQKILSDKRLVEDTIDTSVHVKGYGRRRIRAELMHRGIAGPEIERALEHYSREEEKGIAERMAQNRWEKLEKVDPKKRMKRLYNFLISRGFDFDLSRSIAHELEYKHEDV